MFSLVKYCNEDEFKVVNSKSVLQNGNKCSVKSGMGRFEATVIAKNDNKNFLLKLKAKREQMCSKKIAIDTKKHTDTLKSYPESQPISAKNVREKSRALRKKNSSEKPLPLPNHKIITDNSLNISKPLTVSSNKDHQKYFTHQPKLSPVQIPQSEIHDANKVELKCIPILKRSSRSNKVVKEEYHIQKELSALNNSPAFTVVNTSTKNVQLNRNTMLPYENMREEFPQTSIFSSLTTSPTTSTKSVQGKSPNTERKCLSVDSPVNFGVYSIFNENKNQTLPNFTNEEDVQLNFFIRNTSPLIISPTNSTKGVQQRIATSQKEIILRPSSPIKSPIILTDDFCDSNEDVQYEVLPTNTSPHFKSPTFLAIRPEQKSSIENVKQNCLQNRSSYVKSPIIFNKNISKKFEQNSETDLQNSDLSFNSIPHNSTEKSFFSEKSIVVSNESLSEYMPDSKNNLTVPSQSSTFDVNSSSTSQKSVIVVSSPVNITKINVPYSIQPKKHFCLFCKTLQTKLVRHLLLKHGKEPKVKEFSKLPKKHKERLKIISELRKEGDFIHNTNNSLNSGILIVSRQQISKAKNVADDYVCCSTCKAFFSKRTLRKHVRKCTQKKHNDRNNFSAGRSLTQYMHQEANEVLRTVIFPKIRLGKIANVIRFDELIIKFGNKQAEKYLEHQHEMIRAQLRLLGRFKIALQELCPEIQELKEVLKPQLFDICLKALRRVAGWNHTSISFKTPAVATSLTTLIKKCAKKQQAEFIKEQKEDEKNLVENFLKLWDDEIPTLVNKKACEDQANQKREKKIILPSREDIKKLYDFLKTAILKHMEKLKNKFCENSWTELIKHSLIFIQLFNRRRPGEIERLKVASFENRESITESVEKDALKNISQESLTLAKQYVRLTIRGKLGRTVSVLLSPLSVDAINTIQKYREIAGIPKTNDYIFCRKTVSKLSTKYIRACPLLKQFAEECCADIPESLRGTTLRKHIATYISFLNIEEASVDKLANFMGHHKDIHKNYYRMSVPVSEITCVSKFLMKAIADDNNDDDFNKESDVEEMGKVPNTETPNDSDVSQLTETIDETVNKKRRSTSPYGKTRRIRWNSEEKGAIQSHFGCLHELEKLPSLFECVTAIRKYKVLQNRTPQQVKTWVDNQRRYK